MLKKRVVGVVTVKNGWAVQSFGYDRYLPIGRPQCSVENLDRWGADEILVQVIDRSAAQAGPDFGLLKRLGKLGVGTPLIYSGGIRTVADAVNVIQSGADRVAVDALLIDRLAEVRGISERLGAQAVIAALPLCASENGLRCFDYRSKTLLAINVAILKEIEQGTISEVLAIDFRHEGHPGAFDDRLVRDFPLPQTPLIAFGGITEPKQMAELLSNARVSAVAIGNFLSYGETRIQKIKEQIAALPIRAPQYKQETTSFLPPA